MDVQNFKESFWRSIKFFLLFVMALCFVYIILTKFMFKIPIADNQKLLISIAEFEKVIETEKISAENSKNINENIKNMEFDIYQVQRQEDVKREIHKTQNPYKENNMNSKYKFSLQVKNILQINYNTREKNSKLKYNIELIKKNLTECQANI